MTAAPEQMTLALEHCHPGGVLAPEAGPLDPGRKGGAKECERALCPLCGGRLRVETLALVYPQPGTLRIVECIGKGEFIAPNGHTRSRPKGGCGRWRAT